MKKINPAGESTLSDRFSLFIRERNLCSKKQPVLLAVSGGIDSVVMARLFYESGFKTGIAHINFGLRGKESEGDERFVEKLAKNMKAPFYSVRMDTEQYASSNKISIQMAARELRYNWLEEMRDRNGYSSIAVAHHMQDVAETVLINLLRGTGIAGMHGMLPVNGKIIRPLLFATKAELVDFANSNKLKWREDASNETDDYVRNLIRHKVLPVFEKINPSYEKTFMQNASHFHDASLMVNEYIENVESHILKYERDGSYTLPIKFFGEHPAGATILYEILKKSGFTPAVVKDISGALDKEPGKIFYSATHRVVLDRELLLIGPAEKETGETVMHKFDDRLELVNDDFVLKIFPLQMDKNLLKKITSGSNKHVAYADASRVKFPVSIRTWKHGDVFHPFGMKGKKKVSDFYTDLKLSLAAKERTWLLTDAEKIVWIMGHRLDSRVAITEDTQYCYRFEFTAS